MELTGKCKKEFEKWLVCGDGSINFEKYYNDKYGSDDPYTWFTELPKSMRYGVLEDYFDSVGVNISSFPHYEFHKSLDNILFNTRPESRTAAIEKGDKLRNEVLNK